MRLFFGLILAFTFLALSSGQARATERGQAYQEFVSDDGVRIRVDFTVVENQQGDVNYLEAHDVKFTVSGKQLKYGDEVRVDLANRSEENRGAFGQAHTAEFKKSETVDNRIPGAVVLKAWGKQKYSTRQVLEVRVNNKLLRDSLPHEGRGFNGSMLEAARRQGATRR